MHCVCSYLSSSSLHRQDSAKGNTILAWLICMNKKKCNQNQEEFVVNENRATFSRGDRQQVITSNRILENHEGPTF